MAAERPKEKILLTGGAGFIGSHVITLLLRRGDEVISVDEVNDYYDPSIKQENLEILEKVAKEEGSGKYTFYKQDIGDVEGMRKIFEEHKPEIICHLAARAGVRASIEQPFLYCHSNLTGTMTMLEMAKEFKVKNFVFASSSSVYGDRPNPPFRETDNVDNPVSPYAATKKAGELLCYTYHHLHKFPVSCLRFFTVYGPRGRPDMAIFTFVDNIKRGKPIKQFGDGTTKRDYTFINDIVSGVVGAIDSYPNYPGYEIYNLGKGDLTTLKEFIDMVQELLGIKANINIMPMQPGDVSITQADIAKAKKQLGFNPQTPIREGLKEFIAWYLDHYHKDEQK
eukprot:CAMPEP_0201521918 /NCGR_PEP_ID=MMETSP0161_2-20130828/16351_1 /ASSEMBLY_ACC=CAM_ASM_000251 /TAXON_ID=180227 /ORGANISM="Neoparamoeba aestuarina, Strain SoJaBio B1-5/56/2" /LENGTH=337 /DNA_ID=CAMNT_0047920655 /DNA_START=33 /DNA_END=1046 /DNA_ORIENTATION=+